MKKLITIGLYVLLFIPAMDLYGKNLSILSRSALTNFELLDVYINENLAYIPAGLGGLNIVDISDPADPIVMSEYRANNCDWGRMYAWAANDEYAFGAGRECGIHIIDVKDPSSPRFISQYADQGDLRYEHVELQGAYLFLSRHQGGVEIVEASNPASPRKINVLSTVNAWASLAHDSLLFVADGASGIKIVDISVIQNPVILASFQTSGSAKDLALHGKHLFVAVGAAGVDMIDISDPEHPILRDNYNTSGYASRVSANNHIVAVSDWDDVEILSHQNKKLERVGYKNTGGRVMAIGLSDSIVLSAEWAKLTIYQYGEIPEADIDMSTRRIEFSRTLPGDFQGQSFVIENNGGTALTISDEKIQNSDFSIQFGSFRLLPGDSTRVDVTYRPASTRWRGELTFSSTDPDESVSNVVFAGNYDVGPMVGDPVPTFQLQSINGFGAVHTDELLGSPVVIAFFTAW